MKSILQQSPPGKRQRAVMDQRTRILDAARRLFAEQGPEPVTMADVAAEAGVARATVFNQFGSKHALVEGITEGVLSYYRAMLDNAIADTDAPVPDLIRALADFMGYGIEEERAFYRGVFREIAKLMVGLSEGGPVEQVRRDAVERLVQLMLRGQARGELSREHRAEDLAAAFDSLMNGTIVHWLYDDAQESLRERMRCAAEIFLGSIAIEPRRPDRPQRSAGRRRSLPDIQPARDGPGVIRPSRRGRS